MNRQSTTLIIVTLIMFCGCKKSMQDNLTPAEPRRFASEQYTAVTERNRFQRTLSVEYNAEGMVSNQQQNQTDSSTSSSGLLGESQFSSQRIKTSYEYNKGFVVKKTENSTNFIKYVDPKLGSTTSTVQNITTYTYNSENQLTQEEKKSVVTGGIGANSVLTTYAYDTQKNLTGRTTLVTQGTLISTTKEFFGYRNNTLISYSFLDAGFNMPYADYKFDANGWLQQIGPDAKLQRKFTYDERGNVIRVESYIPGKLLHVYEYEYDNVPTPQSLIPPFKGHPVGSLYRQSPNNMTRWTVKEPDYQNGSSGLVTSLDLKYTPTYNTDGLLGGKIGKKIANPGFFEQYTYTYVSCK